MMANQEKKSQQKQSFFQGDLIEEEQQLEDMKNNKRSFLWFSIKNSDQYEKVMSELNSLNEHLNEKIYDQSYSYEQRENRLNWTFDMVKLYYFKLQYSCQEYLEKNKGIRWTSNGRKRFEMISNIYNQASYEANELLTRKETILKGYLCFPQLTFKEILKDLRTEIIDITGRTDIGKFGAAISTGLTIGEGENTRFFKPEEFALKKIKDEDIPSIISQLVEKLAKGKKEKKVFNEIFNSDPEMLPVYLDNYKFKEKNDENLKKFLNNLIENGCSINNKGNIVINNSFELDTEAKNRFCNILNEINRLTDFGFTTNAYAKIKPGNEVSKRNVATSRLFSALGESDLVTKSRLAVLREKGKPDKKGIIMTKANGKAVQDLAKDLKDISKQNITIKFSKDAQRKFVILQLGDYIAGQIDRHLGNYFVDYEITEEAESAEVKIKSIQGIDNDMSFGKLKGKDSLNGMNKLFSFIGKYSKKLSLPYIDKDFADALQNLNAPIIKYTFADLLDNEEMVSLLDRVKSINQAINEHYDNNHKLDKDKWNQTSLDQIRSNKNNYLAAFIDEIEAILKEGGANKIEIKSE